MPRLPDDITPVRAKVARFVADERIAAGSWVALKRFSAGPRVLQASAAVWQRQDVVGVALAEAESRGQVVPVALSGSTIASTGFAAGDPLFLSGFPLGSYEATPQSSFPALLGVAGDGVVKVLIEKPVEINAPAEPTFSPLDLGPVAWWDGTDTSTMSVSSAGSGPVPSVGDAVERWVDKAGGAVLNNSSSFPTLGNSGVQFDGVDQSIRQTSSRDAYRFLHDNSGGSIFVFFEPLSVGSFDIIVGNAGASTAVGFFVQVEPDNDFQVSIGPEVSAQTPLGEYSANARHSVGFTLGSDVAHYFVDGVEEVVDSGLSGFSTGDSANELTLGARPSSTGSLNFHGVVEHIVVFDKVLSAQDMADLDSWARGFQA